MTSDELVETYEGFIRSLIEQGYGHSRLAKALSDKTGTHVTRWKARNVRKLLQGPSTPSSKPPKHSIQIDNPDEYHRVITATGLRIKSLDDLLNTANVDRSRWRVTSWKANAYEQASKVNDQIKITTLHQVKANLVRKFSATVSPPRTQYVSVDSPVRVRNDAVRRAAFIPDLQVGYRWTNRFRRLVPMHDRKALDATIKLCAFWQPETIVLLGDMADFAPLSKKYPSDASLRGTVQAQIDELHWWLVQLRVACPDADVVYLAGNHEARMHKTQVGDELERITQADTDDPVVTVQHLLRLDELNVRYVGPYGSDYWMWDGLIQVTHGNVVRSGGGSTAAAVVKSIQASQVYGHIHRLEHACRTIHDHRGSRVVSAMSPGCLCRIDKPVVPGFSNAGRDWQQGVGIAYCTENGDVHMSALPIHNGALFWEDKQIVGDDRVEDIVKSTGWTQFRNG